MSILKEMYTLNNGLKIPKLAYGTWQIPNQEAYQAVKDALEVGYRHIDTAKSYHNEEAVGRAIRDSKVARSDVFITTKLRAPALGYQETLEAFEAQRQTLGVDYVDLYIMHAPWPWDDRGNSVHSANQQAYLAMEHLVHKGQIRAIGLSNFNVEDMQAILEVATIVPAVNQIRFAVGYTQDDIVRFCKAKGILVEAYSPLATGAALGDKKLQKLAQELDLSVAQLCLRYCLDKETLPIPKTKTKSRMIENTQLDFNLSEAQIKLLDQFQEIQRN